MDREQTPLKQRQKRSSNRSSVSASNAAGEGPATARAFRSNGPTQRGRVKSAANTPPPPAPVALARPPLTILRAPPTGSSDAYYPPSPSAVPVPKTPTLYDPNARPTASPQQQQQHHRNSMLRVNTAQGAPGIHANPASASPMGPTMAPQSLRKHSLTPGSAAQALPPPSVLQRPNAASAVAPLVSAPPTSTKLIASNFQFAGDIPTKLATCLELSNFTVIGTLGFEGVGKSTLLSLLAAMSFEASPATAKFDVETLRDRTLTPYFLAERLETQLALHQETQGVDLLVACEAPRLRANLGGLVLLDTQPLLSASHLAEVLSRNESSSMSSSSSLSSSSAARFGGLSPEQQIELASLQIAILMMSVCHYVIVPLRDTNGSVVDLELVELLRKVHDKMQQCRLPNVSGHVVKDKHHAQLLFVANESSDATVRATDEKAMRALERLLPTEWLYKPKSSPGPGLPTAKGSGAPLWKFATLKASTASPEHIAAWKSHALQWSRVVESLPASPSFTKSSPTSAPTAPPPLTLKEWLSNTARVWESIKRSGALTEEYSTRDHY